MATAPLQTSDASLRPIKWASDAQRWLVEAGPQPTLLLGGVNSAKTVGGCLKILYLAFRYPHGHFAIVRKTSKYLRKTTMQTFYALLDPQHYAHGARNDNDGYLRLNNGSEIFFIHLDTPDSLTLLQGLELNAAMVDQAEEISEGAWEILETRVGRWTNAVVSDEIVQQHMDATGADWPWRTEGDHKPVPPPYLFATANPPGDELHWLWEHFCEESEEWKTKWRAMGYQYRVTDTRENIYALKQNIDVLMSRDEQWVEQFVKGRWGRPAGCIFRVDPLSIIDPDPMLLATIRNTMRLWRALDHGDSAPTACLFGASDGEGNQIVWQEYYQPGIGKDGREYNIGDHRRSITAMSAGLSFRINVADPQIFYKSRNITGYSSRAQRWSIADEYKDRQLLSGDTVLNWTMGDNNEDVSRSRIRELLKIDPNHKHLVTGQRGAPRLYFIARTEEYPHGCDRVIAELKSAKRLQIGESNGRPIFSDERDESIPDHALDALRYAINAHPAPTMAPPLPTQMTATAIGEGRVTLLLPPVQAAAIPRSAPARRWKSRY